MRSFWVKRGEWVIGPVTEQQIRQMAQQQWFRSADLVGIREEGPWTPARSVVPSRGFNAEQTLHRDSVLEPVAPGTAPQLSAEARQSNRRTQSRAPSEPASVSDEASAAGDSAPAWFRRDNGKSQANSTGPARADQELRANSDAASSFIDADSQVAGRFQTAEFEAGSKDNDAVSDSVTENRPKHAPGRRTSSGDWNFDLSTGLAVAGEDSDLPVRRRDEDAAAIPDQLEVDASDDPQRKPVTDWELVIGDLDLDAADDSQLAGSNAEFVPFELSVHSLKTGKVLSAVESAASAELDFARLANLAAGDPAVSRSELPAAPVNAAPPLTISAEERAVRRTIGSDSFQTQLSVLCLTVGLQSCALSAVINGLVYVALRRLFFLSTETFFPWGTGSLEVLEGADLALAGTAMAITFALPFLALSYLIRVDGRVLFYLISLGVALIPAIVLGSGSLNPQAGTVFACLLLALPAVVSAVLCGLLSAKAVEKTLQHLLAASAGVAVLLALSIGFAAPNFSIEYLLRELPPELHVNGGLIYAVLLFYSVQLTLLYFVVSRIARFCLDESTQQFVGQHMLFHWMLTMTAFILVGAVHGELATGWGTAPILLGGLTAVVSLGFNLWSLVGHLEPRLDRLRVED